MLQLERERQESGKKGALSTLEDNASKEIDWEQLEELAAQGKGAANNELSPLSQNTIDKASPD